MSDPARRVALITGASYGIGAATARALAADGCDVAMTDLATDSLAATAAAVVAEGGAALPLVLDLRAQASVEAALAATLARFGRIDVLVNNAGVPLVRPATEITRAEWDQAIAVNLTGAFFMCQAVGRHWIETARPGTGSGAIVSLSSTHGTVGFAGVAGYGIAKAGISHMTRILAIEWAAHGIRVNAVAPGTTETESRAKILADPIRRHTMTERIPLKRFARAEEIAEAIRWLASPASAYVTGQVMLVDGGLTAY